ncbi:MAG TPA: hypothetical protein VGI70_02020, partial [Polyangiales bacterium]
MSSPLFVRAWRSSLQSLRIRIFSVKIMMQRSVNGSDVERIPTNAIRMQRAARLYAVARVCCGMSMSARRPRFTRAALSDSRS